MMTSSPIVSVCLSRPEDLSGGAAGGWQESAWIIPFLLLLTVECLGGAVTATIGVLYWCSWTGLHEAEGVWVC